MTVLQCPNCGNYYRFGTDHRCPINPAEPLPRPEQVRGETHGDYGQMSSRIQDLKTTMRSGPSWDKLSAAQAEALELIATKIGRIVCGDPNCCDHWADIAGYANLVHSRIAQKPAARNVD